MGELPGYDDWKTRDPDEDRCEYCGVSLRGLDGWQPDRCTGECRRSWRDADAEYDAWRDVRSDPLPAGWDDD
jgi:hypothetical protein